MLFCVLLSSVPPATAQDHSFLVARPPGWEAKVDAEAIRADLNKAIAAAMGSGHGVEQERLLRIRRVLSDIFEVLPKNANGRIERPMLRYALHRYFAQQYSITVKGLEPTKYSSRSDRAGAQILLDQVPAYAESILEGRFARHGFGLQDATIMAATLEQLVLASGAGSLHKAYDLRNQSTGGNLGPEALGEVLDAYVLQWLVGDGADIDPTQLLNNREIIEESVPQWGDIGEFARGEVARHEFERRHTSAGNPFKTTYSFADAQEVVQDITAGFGLWWEQECQSIKSNLAAEDSTGSGRVRLADFYRRSMEGEWRFGESEAYLRELGALDDSSYWRGPQVIIPNYLQATSNCIIASTYYLVCCVNECEAKLKRVEDSVKAPVAEPAQLLQAIEAVMALDGRDQQGLHKGLEKQLNRIAETHSGQVPLHGRLFSQLMHYAFPQECPFPHRAGVAGARTPQEFGDAYIATPQEMKMHVSQLKRNVSAPGDMSEEEQWGMTQWLHEEELLTDYAELRGPAVLGPVRLFIGIVFLAGFAWAVSQHGDAFRLQLSAGKQQTTFGGVSVKQHLV